jgi:ATP-dependent helicase/nuclease subunit A
MIEKEGEQAGFIGEENKAVMQTLRTQLQQLFDMPRGQWLIDAHPDAESEYAFCVTQGDKTSTYIVDRMFNIEGQRWIIDFKTGLDDESSEDKHREQVSRYAHYLKIHFQTPVRCGLYYLSSNRWVEWVEDVT